jgi:mRNA interferase RelE/StbE
MPDYLSTFARSAERDLHRLDPPVARRVIAAVERLAANPRSPGCVKLSGSQNEWRIRVGDWRVLYSIDDAAHGVDIAGMRHRGEVYR